MALRIVLAVMLTAFSALAGRAFANTHVKRAAQLRTLMDDLQMLRTLTLERLLPLATALMEMKCSFLTALADKLGDDNVTSAYIAWDKLKVEERRRGGMLDGYTDEDLEPLDALITSLGSTGRRAHEALYVQALERLGRREAEYRKLGNEKLKLHTSLGALAGLAASVLLI